jgi:hypothetical protein
MKSAALTIVTIAACVVGAFELAEVLHLRQEEKGAGSKLSAVTQNQPARVEWK